MSTIQKRYDARPASVSPRSSFETPNAMMHMLINMRGHRSMYEAAWDRAPRSLQSDLLPDTAVRDHGNTAGAKYGGGNGIALVPKKYMVILTALSSENVPIYRIISPFPQLPIVSTLEYTTTNYYITYLPSMLLTGMCRDEMLESVAVIACWCMVIQLVIRGTQKKYFKTYDGVGMNGSSAEYHWFQRNIWSY